jgi:hypothetical protein
MCSTFRHTALFSASTPDSAAVRIPEAAAVGHRPAAVDRTEVGLRQTVAPVHGSGCLPTASMLLTGVKKSWALRVFDCGSS